MIRRTVVILLLAFALALPATAYTIYLKDGSRIIARVEYVIEGDRAIITLENGTQTFLPTVEIDVARTKAANTSNLGSALIFEDGEFVERSTNVAPGPKRETVTDLIARGDATVQSRPRTPSDSTEQLMTAATSLESMQRQPLRDIELSTAVKKAFADRGLEGTAIYQGTDQKRPLVELVAESEASVFHSLELAAEALLAIRESHPDCEVMEILMATSTHERAGEFVLTTAMAEQIQGKEVELAAFYIEHVRF